MVSNFYLMVPLNQSRLVISISLSTLTCLGEIYTYLNSEDSISSKLLSATLSSKFQAFSSTKSSRSSLTIPIHFWLLIEFTPSFTSLEKGAWSVNRTPTSSRRFSLRLPIRPSKTASK